MTGRSVRAFVLYGALAMGWAAAGMTQPFVGWTRFMGNGNGQNGHLEVPDAPELRITGALTVEAWILLSSAPTGTSCRSLVGKNRSVGYWLGACGDGGGGVQLRSSIAGAPTEVRGGILPVGLWTHVAMTSDGGTRVHYVDGELVASASETAAPGTSSDPLWIGSDPLADASPSGMVNEVRLWNVARRQSDLQATLNIDLTTPQAGLLGVWRMSDTGDLLGGHPGTFVGSYAMAGPEPGGSCPIDPGALCLWNRFVVTSSWRIGGPDDGGASGAGTIVGVPNPGSGLFWFFAASDWELAVKAIDGCALNQRWWIFSSAMTNVFYRLEVADLTTGSRRVYFNYPGPPAPAVTDTVALACP
jgi:hypothetical protein